MTGGAATSKFPLRQGLRLAARLLACHCARQAAATLAWAALAAAAWSGRAPSAGLGAWALLLLGLAPLRALETEATARCTAAARVWLRRRRFATAPVGGSPLASALEAADAERHGVEGALAILLSFPTLALALVLLTIGPSGPSGPSGLTGPSPGTGADPLAGWRPPLLAAWWLAGAAAACCHAKRRRAATRQRQGWTADIAEATAGQRTRRSQQPRAHRHERDAAHLAADLRLAGSLDRAALRLQVGLGRSWLLAGLATFLPATAAARGSAAGSAPLLALHLAGVALAAEALARFGQGALDLGALGIGTGGLGSGLGGLGKFGVVLGGLGAPAEPEARTAPATRAAPDRPPVPAPATAWRRQTLRLPPPYENHLFAASLAFNLLLGRAWPPAARDVDDAVRLCSELGLDGLLARLPDGVHERVGEAGWSLSAGEACRVFLARALLQEPAVLIVDQGLAALDPDAALLVLGCLRRRVRTLLLVAPG